jgi:hypothetical protein
MKVRTSREGLRRVPRLFGEGEGKQRKRSLFYPEIPEFGKESYKAMRLRSVIPA